MLHYSTERTNDFFFNVVKKEHFLCALFPVHSLSLKTYRTRAEVFVLVDCHVKYCTSLPFAEQLIKLSMTTERMSTFKDQSMWNKTKSGFCFSVFVSLFFSPILQRSKKPN